MLKLRHIPAAEGKVEVIAEGSKAYLFAASATGAW